MPGHWEFLVTLNDRLRRLRDPAEMQTEAARMLGPFLGASCISYAPVDGDRRLTEGEREAMLAPHTGALLVVPLVKDGRWAAAFEVHRATPHSWTREEIALCETAAERIWEASERARVEAALRRSESRRAFLRQLNETIRPLADPARILAETCRLLGQYLRANRVIYGEIDEDDCVVVDDYVDGLPSLAGRFRWSDLGGSRTGEILQGGTLAVNDTSIAPHTADECAALQSAGIAAYICPLLIKDGRFVGVFGIHSRTPRTWTIDEIELAQEVAERIWATLEHRKADAERRANEERLAFLLRLNDALRPLSDPAEVLEAAARMLGEHLDVARVGYADLQGDAPLIRREHVRGVAPLAGRAAGITLGPILRETMQRGEPMVVSNVDMDSRLGEEDRAGLRSRDIASMVGVTLFKDGRMMAAFGANHNRPRAWTASEVDLVRDVAARTWDAVERARAEAAIRAQRQRLNLAVEASAGGSWTWIAATNQADWDQRFRELYGFAPDAPATPDAWLPLVHEDDRPHVLKLLAELATSTIKDRWESTFRIVRPDGRIAWIQSRGRAERDASGALIRLTGLDLDFNERRMFEEAQQLRRDEEHDRALRTLLETATQGIVAADAHGVIVTANPAFESMFGWPAQELIGRQLDALIPSVFLALHDRSAGTHLVGARKDGSTFPLDVTITHVPTPSGGRTFAFVTDITERQRAAYALQERSDELEYQTMQLRQMASDLMLTEQRAREQIAKTLHDGLQQLLVIVALNVDEILKRDTGSDAPAAVLLLEAKQHVDEAIAAARSLNLELFPPVLQRSGLPAALRWLANWTHERYKVDVQAIVDPNADSARKDIRTLLFESIRELLFNAVKHAQTDRITLELTGDGDDRLCITVTDHGVGFDAKRLDERSKAGQTGWGLFSIRERVALLGGRVDIASAPGRGTQVRLVVPRGMTDASTAASPATSPTPTTRPLEGADRRRSTADALRILIVDDHSAVRGALREILNHSPQLAVVGEAANGFEAIAHAHTLRPDVVLMDVGMPHMDGVEATSRIRADLPGIQILGLSMQSQSETLHAIEDAGAADFFVKGVDTQRLIDHLLALHEARSAAVRPETP